MTEEQFHALLTMVQAVASARAGEAVNQRRPRDNEINAVNYARSMFDLPPIDEEQYDA